MHKITYRRSGKFGEHPLYVIVLNGADTGLVYFTASQGLNEWHATVGYCHHAHGKTRNDAAHGALRHAAWEI